VVVGGHSLRRSMTTAYRPGTSRASRAPMACPASCSSTGASSPTPESAADAQKALDGLDKSDASPWLTFGGIAAPYTGLFNSTGALGAITDPDSPSTGQAFPLLPANLSRRCRRRTSAVRLRARQRHVAPVARRRAGAHRPLAQSGDPRGWVDDEITPIKRYATDVRRLGA